MVSRVRHRVTKDNFELKIPEQSGQLGGKPGPRPTNGNAPAKTGRRATIPT